MDPSACIPLIKGAVHLLHHIMIERADVGADRVMRNSHNFIDHNLGGLFEIVSRRRFNGKSENGRINDFGRQEADCDAPKGREEIGLQDKVGPRLPAIMALCSDGKNIAALLDSPERRPTGLDWLVMHKARRLLVKRMEWQDQT